jgi:putative Ca2+/H+ antiporter (TMEM165/GDT1 family)
MEGLISVVGFICCGVLAASIAQYIKSSADPPVLKLYPTLFFLAIVALYFFVRFIHWSWETPVPFRTG